MTAWLSNVTFDILIHYMNDFKTQKLLFIVFTASVARVSYNIRLQAQVIQKSGRVPSSSSAFFLGNYNF